MKLVISTVALTIALAGTSLAHIRPQGPGYLLRRSFDSKQAVTYSWTRAEQCSVGAMPAMTMDVSTQVIGRTASNATIQYTLCPRGPRPQVHRVSIDRLNNGPSPNPLTGVRDFSFPKNAVKVGQTWTAMVSVPQLQGKAISLTCTLKGFRTVGSVKVADIRTEGYLDQNGQRVWLRGTYSFRTSDGSLQSIRWDQEMIVRNEHSSVSVNLDRKGA